MRILLVEDNRDLAANVGEFLAQRGHTVDFAGDGLSGLHLAATQAFDALVLDVSLPGLDGLALCRKLRHEALSPVPVLMLTARDTEADTLRGFDAGADDYLTKPFSLAELEARLLALGRRGRMPATRLQVADLTLDPRTLEARRGERVLTLTAAQLRLLEALMRASPGVLSRRDASRALWGEDPPDSEAALRGHIHALRALIDAPPVPRLLHTLHGIGYRLALAEAPPRAG